MGEMKLKEAAAKKEQEDADKKLKEEAEKMEKEESERKLKDEAEKKEKEETEKKLKEAVENRELEEAERKLKEAAEKKEKEDAEKKLKEAAEKKEKEETEKKLKEEVKKRDKKEAERKSKKSAKKKEKEDAERKLKEKADKIEEERENIEADRKLKEESEKKKINADEKEAKQANDSEMDSISGEEASKKEQEISDGKEKEEIETEERGKAEEMKEPILENNSVEIVQDQELEKDRTEATDSMIARDIVNTTTDETLMNGELKEDDIDTGASSYVNGKEEASKLASTTNDVTHSSDADKVVATAIKRVEVGTECKNDNNKGEGCQLRRRGTTSRRNDSKSFTSATKPDCVDGKHEVTANTNSTSHTFHISRVPEKSYSRPTRTRSQSVSRRRRSKSANFPTNDLVSVLANITIRYQEVSIGGHCKGRVEVIKAMKEEVSRNRQRLYKH